MAAICTACPHACRLESGRLGRCQSRRANNRHESESPDGLEGAASSTIPEGYGRITSLALDPIEKKPLARFRPGTTVLSLGSYGCNMDCPFCQNASIAHASADDVEWRVMQPAEVVDLAASLEGRRCIGVAYTYNEPLVNWEFLRDAGELAHDAGLANVIVSNGMVTARTLDAIAPLVDAANIDLKCFTEEGYDRLGGNLRAVQHTIEHLASLPTCHLEVTTLVVPGLSDDEAQIDAMARWLASLDCSIPYHLTRFFPRHRMSDEQPTPIRTLYRLADVASHHLDDVLLGNV